MTVYYGTFVYGIIFYYTNGAVVYCGNTNTGTPASMSLTNSYVSALYMRSGSWIDSLQFQTTDLTTGVTSLSPHWGGWGGGLTTLDASTIASNANFFQINQFSGTFDSSYMRTWTVSCYYTVCNSAG